MIMNDARKFAPCVAESRGHGTPRQVTPAAPQAAGATGSAMVTSALLLLTLSSAAAAAAAATPRYSIAFVLTDE
jgi:hypothetical protein